MQERRTKRDEDSILSLQRDSRERHVFLLPR